jgi:TetR/AcrR family transcriptional regulator, transcriptional repressor of aconitase
MPKVSEAHLAARRNQILAAAARCFSRDGFHRTSMQDIVRESGISAGLVYRYFAGKDDMIVAIVTEWHDTRRTLLDVAPGDPGELGGLAASYFGLLRSIGEPANRDNLRLGIQVWAEAVRSPQIRELVRRGVDVPRTNAAGLLRGSTELDPDALARILIAIYQGLMVQTAWDDTVDNTAFVDTLASILAMVLPAADLAVVAPSFEGIEGGLPQDTTARSTTVRAGRQVGSTGTRRSRTR